MLFNCSAFLLISVLGMSSKRWSHSCSVPMQPSPVVYMVIYTDYRHEQLCSNETFLFTFFNCLDYLVSISMDLPGMTISPYTSVCNEVIYILSRQALTECYLRHGNMKNKTDTETTIYILYFQRLDFSTRNNSLNDGTYHYLKPTQCPSYTLQQHCDLLYCFLT